MARAIGIVGGMGPEATADLFLKIVRATPARRDQDHLRVLVDSNPAIPDRAAALAGRGPDPLPALVAAARNLERAGAGLLCIACNTAHAYYPGVAAAVGVPVLHVMEEVAAAIRARYPLLRRVGLLATRATVALGLYHRALARRGLQALVPDELHQRLVDRAIYPPDGVKAGGHAAARPRVLRAARRLVEAGAQCVVLGCTELPLVVGRGDLPVPVVDATDVLARAAVREALGTDVDVGF